MLVNRSLTYDYVGNITQIVDSVNSETINYTYDELDRMLTASAPSGESYTYSKIGNIATKDSQQYTYGDSDHAHAVTAFNGVSYAYDANGSMTTRGIQTIVYDLDNRPVKVLVSGSPICQFGYNGDGTRLKRADSNGTVHYVGGLYEKNLTGPVVTKYYFANLGSTNRLIAFRKDGTLYYVGTDHLGGTIRVASATFSDPDQMRYTPYGVSRDSGTNLNTDHKYTSQIEDASIGLYWYASRAYDPAIGRFVAPDTIVPEPGNPQALNRYSYANNNPVKYSDPTGHEGYYDLEMLWHPEPYNGYGPPPLPPLLPITGSLITPEMVDAVRDSISFRGTWGIGYSWGGSLLGQAGSSGEMLVLEGDWDVAGMTTQSSGISFVGASIGASGVLQYTDASDISSLASPTLSLGASVDKGLDLGVNGLVGSNGDGSRYAGGELQVGTGLAWAQPGVTVNAGVQTGEVVWRYNLVDRFFLRAFGVTGTRGRSLPNSAAGTRGSALRTAW